MYDSVIFLFTTGLWFNFIFLFECKYSVAKKNCDITVLEWNMVERKHSSALNKCMGKHSCGCGITRIVLWILRSRALWRWKGGYQWWGGGFYWWMNGVRTDQKVSHNIGPRSPVLYYHGSPFMHCLYSYTDGFHYINGLRNSGMYFLCYFYCDTCFLSQIWFFIYLVCLSFIEY